MNDYISREAVVRYLKEYSEKECNSDSPYGMITSSVLNKAERALSEMPATDVQSIKHGRWTYPYKDKDINQCSECHSYVQDKISNVREMFAYCPFCGARMDLTGGDTNG